MSIFEQASRVKLRWVGTSQGTIGVEEVWQLPLKSERGDSLDKLAKQAQKQVRDATEINSFVDETTTGNPEAQLKLDILKHIIGVRKEENKTAADQAAKRELRQKVQEIILRKREGALESKSEEELLALLKD